MSQTTRWSTTVSQAAICWVLVAGTNFGIVRYDISELETYVPRGTTVDVGSWSEAESFDAQGELKYHHFAFDRVIDGGSWQIPE